MPYNTSLLFIEFTHISFYILSYSPWYPLVCFLYLGAYLHFVIYIRYIFLGSTCQWYHTVCIFLWFISLAIIFSRSVHNNANCIVLFFFMDELSCIVCLCVYIYIYVCVCIYIHIYIFFLWMSKITLCVYMCLYMYIYLYIYMYTYISQLYF